MGKYKLLSFESSFLFRKMNFLEAAFNFKLLRIVSIFLTMKTKMLIFKL